jgi:hypothetical protein
VTRAQFSSLCVTFASLMSAVHLLDGSLFSTTLSGLFLGIFILLEWPLLMFAARAPLIGSLGLFLFFWLSGRTSPILLADAIDRAAFLAFFVVALGTLRDAAQTSKLVRTCGRIIVNQSPGRRYLTLTVGGHLMSALMSLGAVNLLGTMVRRAVHESRNSDDERVRQIRLHRMSLAVLRSFCAVPIWAPTSVAIAIIVSSSLDVTWRDMLPYGGAATLLYLGLGWALDRLTFQRPKVPGQPAPRQPFLRPFAALTGIVILVPITGGVIARQLDLNLISGLLIAIPFISIGWTIIQKRHYGMHKAAFLTGRRISRKILPSFRETRNEITIFAASGFLAVILLPQIDVQLLSAGISRFGLTEGPVLVVASWVMIGLALLSVNPLVTAILVIETLVALPGMAFAPEVVALMISVTWAIVVGLSPFATSTRLLGRCIGHMPSEIGFRWNLSFVVIAALILDATLLVIG